MCSACLLLSSGQIGRMLLTRSRAACIYAQKCWRGAAVRSSRVQSDASVTLLQAVVRRCRARSEVKMKRKAYPIYCDAVKLNMIVEIDCVLGR
jgi:hypothetical protein